MQALRITGSDGDERLKNELSAFSTKLEIPLRRKVLLVGFQKGLNQPIWSQKFSLLQNVVCLEVGVKEHVVMEVLKLEENKPHWPKNTKDVLFQCQDFITLFF